MSGTRSGWAFWIDSTQQIFAIPIEGEWERERLHGYSTIDAPRIENQQHHDLEKACLCCCYICILLFWVVFNIYMIVIGAVERCAAGMGITGLYLMVQGGVNLFHLILCILAACAAAKDKKFLEKILSVRHILFISFLYTWTLIGILNISFAMDDKDSQCNDVLLISALICLSLHFVFIFLLCSCYFCYKCMKFCASED